MKKAIIISVFLMLGNFIMAQKAITRNGQITFEGSMPAFEEIKATTNSASAILDQATGNFAALALIKSFKFKSPLMEEHFNENYMESNLFPKATFKGKILDFDPETLTGAKTKSVYYIEGDLTIHGVTKKIKTEINLTPSKGKILLTANFTIKPSDYNIEIPSIVKDKIAKNIKTKLGFVLEAP